MKQWTYARSNMWVAHLERCVKALRSMKPYGFRDPYGVDFNAPDLCAALVDSELRAAEYWAEVVRLWDLLPGALNLEGRMWRQKAQDLERELREAKKQLRNWENKYVRVRRALDPEGVAPETDVALEELAEAVRGLAQLGAPVYLRKERKP